MSDLSRDEKKVTRAFIRHCHDKNVIRVVRAYLQDGKGGAMKLEDALLQGLFLKTGDDNLKLFLSRFRKGRLSDGHWKVLRPLLRAESLDDEHIKTMRAVLRSESLEHNSIDELRRSSNSRMLVDLLKRYKNGEFETDRFKLLYRLIRVANYVEDLFATQAQVKWLFRHGFSEAYDKAHAFSGWNIQIRWRMHVLGCCAANAVTLDGDFVECGVDRGGGAFFLINYLGREAFEGKDFYLFDTFKGPSPEQLNQKEKDSCSNPEWRYQDVAEEVKARFADVPFVRIVKGVVPETLAHFKGKAVSFLHIDMNVAYPEVAALDFFWPLLSPGAHVVFDDYGFPPHEEQRRQLDEVAERLGREILALPTGQGLLWK